MTSTIKTLLLLFIMSSTCLAKTFPSIRGEKHVSNGTTGRDCVFSNYPDSAAWANNASNLGGHPYEHFRTTDTPAGASTFSQLTDSNTVSIDTAGNVAANSFISKSSGTITRNVDGYISSVALTGRTLTITRDVDNYITSVTDGTRTWTYTRDENNRITSWTVSP